ncbi:hypothetical protein M407DRAFT_240696 [Tulasnella calospora MUT 4182]|uniref:Uncharacterized protein n=1 Tax=Tulasnella calospora MUT 4182 TaxID=1051891 RepID=A0A0C3QMW9_9AGAM|nr:hypothetical protein M407DRAFT_240696 [Tulasnella calospora MUT 4182]
MPRRTQGIRFKSCNVILFVGSFSNNLSKISTTSYPSCSSSLSVPAALAPAASSFPLAPILLLLPFIANIPATPPPPVVVVAGPVATLPFLALLLLLASLAPHLPPVFF